MKTISRLLLAALVIMAAGCYKIKMTPDPEPEETIDPSPIPLEKNTIYTEHKLQMNY